MKFAFVLLLFYAASGSITGKEVTSGSEDVEQIKNIVHAVKSKETLTEPTLKIVASAAIAPQETPLKAVVIEDIKNVDTTKSEETLSEPTLKIVSNAAKAPQETPLNAEVVKAVKTVDTTKSEETLSEPTSKIETSVAIANKETPVKTEGLVEVKNVNTTKSEETLTKPTLKIVSKEAIAPQETPLKAEVAKEVKNVDSTKSEFNLTSSIVTETLEQTPVNSLKEDSKLKTDIEVPPPVGTSEEFPNDSSVLGSIATTPEEETSTEAAIVVTSQSPPSPEVQQYFEEAVSVLVGQVQTKIPQTISVQFSNEVTKAISGVATLDMDMPLLRSDATFEIFSFIDDTSEQQQHRMARKKQKRNRNDKRRYGNKRKPSQDQQETESDPSVMIGFQNITINEVKIKTKVPVIRVTFKCGVGPIEVKSGNNQWQDPLVTFSLSTKALLIIGPENRTIEADEPISVWVGRTRVSKIKNTDFIIDDSIIDMTSLIRREVKMQLGLINFASLFTNAISTSLMEEDVKNAFLGDPKFYPKNV